MLNMAIRGFAQWYVIEIMCYYFWHDRGNKGMQSRAKPGHQVQIFSAIPCVTASDAKEEYCMQQRLRKILFNPVSLIGLITVVSNLGLLVLLSTVDALSGPYANLVIWLIMPWLVFLGLVLIRIGIRPLTEQDAGRQGSRTSLPDRNDRQV